MDTRTHVSPHLTWAELACHDPVGTPYPLDYRPDRAVALATEFEAVRLAARVPLFVVSAYRTPQWNLHIGGAKASQHVQGRALDLVPARGLTLDDLYAILVRRAVDAGVIRGLGRYAHFCHMDIRPTKTLVEWDAR